MKKNGVSIYDAIFFTKKHQDHIVFVSKNLAMKLGESAMSSVIHSSSPPSQQIVWKADMAIQS
jgi:hypothetical protein